MAVGWKVTGRRREQIRFSLLAILWGLIVAVSDR